MPLVLSDVGIGNRDSLASRVFTCMEHRDDRVGEW